MISKEKANSILGAIDADNGEEVQRILGESIQNGEMTKDQANSILDAIDADDGDVVMSTLSSLVGANEQKPLALRPPEDFTPQLSEMDKLYQSVFPRLTSKEAGQGFLSDIGKGVGDVASLLFRALAGHADALGTLLGGGSIYDVGESYTKQMTSPRATEGAGMIQGTAEDILKNPMNAFLPLTGSIATKTTAGIANPLARGVLGGGSEGLLSGVGEAGMEQRGIKQEGLNTLLGAGGGAVLGGVLSPSIPKQVVTPEESVVSLLSGRVEELSKMPDVDPKQLGKAVDELAQARTAIAQGDDVELPWYMPRDASGAITPDREGMDIPFALYQQRANEVKSGLRTDDPFFMATDEVLAPAVQEIKNQQKQIGDKINEIESRFGGVETTATPVKGIIADELDKIGRRAVLKDVLDENGDVVDQVVSIEWKPNIQRKGKQSSKSLSPEMVQIVEEVALLDDNVNFETLRSIVKDLNQVVKRSATPDPLAQSMLKSLNEKMKQEVRGIIEATDPNTLAEWDDAMSGYAKRKEILDMVKRKTGNNFENAEGWLKSMVTTGARSSDQIARDLQELTGYDVRKASAYARYANETAGIKERGSSLLKSQSDIADELKKQGRKLPIVGQVADVASSVKTALTPKPSAGRASQAVAQAQQKRVMSGAEREDFFNRYFIGISALNPSTNTERKAK